MAPRAEEQELPRQVELLEQRATQGGPQDLQGRHHRVWHGLELLPGDQRLHLERHQLVRAEQDLLQADEPAISQLPDPDESHHCLLQRAHPNLGVPQPTPQP